MGNRLLQADGQPGGLTLAQARREDDEFISSNASNLVMRPDGLAQCLRELPQRLVTRLMAKRIIETLEFIDIHIQHGERFADPLGLRKFCRQAPLKHSTVRNASQEIGHGELFTTANVANQ